MCVGERGGGEREGLYYIISPIKPNPILLPIPTQRERVGADLRRSRPSPKSRLIVKTGDGTAAIVRGERRSDARSVGIN